MSNIYFPCFYIQIIFRSFLIVHLESTCFLFQYFFFWLGINVNARTKFNFIIFFFLPFLEQKLYLIFFSIVVQKKIIKLKDEFLFNEHLISTAVVQFFFVFVVAALRQWLGDFRFSSQVPDKACYYTSIILNQTSEKLFHVHVKI